MALDQKEISRYRDDGVIRIRKFFTAEEVAEIRQELDRYVRDDLGLLPTDACTREADGKSIRNLWRLELYNKFLRQLADSPKIRDVVAELVNGEPVLMAVKAFNKPALVGSGVPDHQDNAYFCQSPPDVLTVWVALDPVAMDNGPVCFVLGSHKDGMRPTAPSGVKGNSIGLAEPLVIAPADQFCCTLGVGDASIHHCETIYNSEPNQTEQSRLGILFVYRGAHTRLNPKLRLTYERAVALTPSA